MSRTSWRYKQRPMKLYRPINRRERNNMWKAQAVGIKYWIPRDGWVEPIFKWQYKIKSDRHEYKTYIDESGRRVHELKNVW